MVRHKVTGGKITCWKGKGGERERERERERGEIMEAGLDGESS